MSDIHAGPDTHSPGDGLCTWHHDAFGEHLRCDSPCDEKAIPLGEFCAEHEIEAAARKHFAARAVTVAMKQATA